VGTVLMKVERGKWGQFSTINQKFDGNVEMAKEN